MIKLIESNNCFLNKTAFYLTPKRLHSFINSQSELPKRIFARYGFSEIQCEKLLDNLKPYLQKNYNNTIESSLECWRNNVFPTKTDIEINENKFKDVFLNQEPRLLLLDNSSISERIFKLKSLDLINGRNDLWNIFLNAPSGYYLQDWKEFLRKYYYIHYKILPWLNKDSGKGHPLMHSPAVVELSYNTIKSRFIFVQRTGYKEIYAKDFDKVNLSTVLLLPIEDFLRMHSLRCSVEEFNGLNKLCASEVGEEDDELFEQLSELAPKTTNKSFIKDNLQEIYMIGSKK